MLPNGASATALVPPRVPIREGTVGEVGTSTPGCFCEEYQNKGVASARVRKSVKTRDLEIDNFALQSLCFDIDAHC
jgi:hypothetical protein